MSKPISYNRPVPNWALPITRILFVCALAVLTFNSVRPALEPINITNFDKVMHLGAYFVLAGLFALAWPKLKLLWVVIVPCFYGGLMEVAQGAMSAGRTGSLLDMAANITGALCAVIMWWLFVRYIWKPSI